MHTHSKGSNSKAGVYTYIHTYIHTYIEWVYVYITRVKQKSKEYIY